MNAFRVEQVVPGKWLVENRDLAFRFWLYGTRSEVLATVARHEAAHATRLGKKPHGAAWRGRIGADMREVAEAKKVSR